MKRFIRHFNEQKDIDSLKYDKVKEKPTPLLKGEDWKNINVTEPPRNSSPEAKSELSMIKEFSYIYGVSSCKNIYSDKFMDR